MQSSDSGFIPARGFQNTALEPVPTFNDKSNPEPLDVVIDGTGERRPHDSLRTPPTSYGGRIRYTVFEFEELLDSSSIDSKGWAQIALTISWNYTLFDAFVVLHGTDSLAYTCSALSFMLRNLGKPVILTGSQAPMLELQNDATDNLLGSLVIAGNFMIPEVCLYFNYKLLRGNRATKVSASAFAAFDSPNFAPLAVMTAMRTNVAWDLVHRPTHIEHFNIQINLDTTHVACLRIFPGIKPEMVDAVLRLEGLRGLVLETFGAGNAPGGQDNAMTNVLAAAIQRGIVIVNVTQCIFLFSIYLGNMLLTHHHRSIRQCQPSLCPRDDSLPRRCRCWSRYDHRSRPDQTRLPSSSAWSNPCICSTRHVHLPPWRTYRTLPAGLPTPRRRIAATSQEPGCTGLRHCAWKPRESEGYPPRGGGVDFE